ncbi:hypothetical protein E0L36_16235 [Streptomyces sp. AJS327]|uniref:hypothetical protein n=1 Tax=Streptomyces sp. AJS327 TaxID=2545265 RepID=UPI0015E0253D|nr:hypothetical protein [Streptomyces sp. AJS327]MBA0052403.1 hypothetical protein [Streptomyces sp. AJS327]
MSTDSVATTMAADERDFVERIAEYYFQNDGLPVDQGRVVGWMLICDPPEQPVSDIVRTLGVPREAVDRIVDQLTPEGNPVKVFERRGSFDEEYTLRLLENSWAPKVRRVFAEFPDLGRIINEGIVSLRAEGVPEERLQRIVNMGRFLDFLSEEMPKILERYEERRANRSDS